MIVINRDESKFLNSKVPRESKYNYSCYTKKKMLSPEFKPGTMCFIGRATAN